MGTKPDLNIYDDGNGWFRYRDWKLQKLPDDSFECVRIRPTEFFRGSSLQSCVKSIDRREKQRDELRLQLLRGTIN